MVDKLKEYEAGIAKEQREAFTPKWVGTDETKCLHCGEGKPAYCENCFQDLITQNVKLQTDIEWLRSQQPLNIMGTFNPYADKFPKMFPPKWPGTCKPEDIKWGMDLAEGPDYHVKDSLVWHPDYKTKFPNLEDIKLNPEELWKKEDKPDPDYEPLVEAIRDLVEHRQELADEINEGRGV